MASIAIQASDGTGSVSAYLVEPNARPPGVVVLIQEIFGVNRAMRDIAAWVADMGFIAACPDLFRQIEPGIDITDKTEATGSGRPSCSTGSTRPRASTTPRPPCQPRASSRAPTAGSARWPTASAAGSPS